MLHLHFIMLKIISNLIFLYLFIFSSNIYAQVELSQLQSTPDFNWMELENDDFRILFPHEYEKQARKTLKLLEHHKKEVQETYRVSPEKIFLVLRPDMATPNGFVTLAPRRSEWYHNAALTPLVGSLDWLHSLAVHEYRHIVQYKYLSESNSKYGYYLFGENILNFLIHMVMPTWYFEGDAVWTETIFTDGGRGRSPRFSSRLKAMVTSDQDLNYDRLLGSDFNQSLPNLYVYGYYLITYGIHKFGDNIWQKIAGMAKDHPWNPYAMYNAFEDITGQNFEEYYQEVLSNLKSKWNAYPQNDNIKYERYTDMAYPIQNNDDLFYLKKENGQYWSLMKNHKELTQLALTPSISRVDLHNGNLIFSQITPNPRYNYSEEQNLYLYNLKENNITQITENKKYIHPKFSPSGEKIAAIEHTSNGLFKIILLNLSGEVLQEFSFPNDIPAEAVWINEDELALIMINENGAKKISNLSIKNSKIKNILPASRNNIFSLAVYGMDIYFEADYQGKVNIFKVNIDTLKTQQCSHEFIQASHPSINNETLFFTTEIQTGKVIRSQSLECEPINTEEITETELYISETNPSDHYYQSEPKPIIIKELKNTEANLKKASDLSGLASPHSWSFIGDRGYQLEGLFTNNLGNTNFNLTLGQDSEEQTPFINGTISYAKYYPIFQLTVDATERRIEKSSGEYENWEERTVLAGFTLPYLYRKNLWQSLNALSLYKGEIWVSDNPFNSSVYLNNEKMQVNTTIFTSSLYRYLRKRDINPSLGYNFQLSYSSMETPQDSTANYYTQLLSKFYFPSFWESHSLSLGYTQELRPRSNSLYRLQKNHYGLINYLFSRGYAYEFSTRFDKYTIEYTLPLIYPNYALKDYFYINRIYANFFYDTTYRIDILNENENLISKGIELHFDTNSFRKFPLSYGLRYIDLQGQQSQQVELYLQIGL